MVDHQMVLLEKAKFCSIVELFYDNSDRRKLGDVSQAFVECIDYALEHRVITSGQELPEAISVVLKKTIMYLGDKA